jgi:hypothetical protein
VWSRDQPEVENLSLSGDSFTISDIWWPQYQIASCGEYQTVYGTVDGVDFQHRLPDLDTLDPRNKHLIILDDLMDETDQKVVSLFTKKSQHRNISVMYIVQNLFHRGKHHSLNAHYMVLFKNPRDVSQIMELAHQMYPGERNLALKPLPELRPYLTVTWWSIWNKTPRISWNWEPSHLSRWGTESVCRVIKRMLHPVSCHSCIRCWGNSMVSQRLKRHTNELVYLQKARPCIRNHLITKTDRSLVDCLCECANNILRGNVPLTKLQKEKLKRNKAGLRALTKKSVSLKKKNAILQKGGFLGSLLAPIASVYRCSLHYFNEGTNLNK